MSAPTEREVRKALETIQQAEEHGTDTITVDGVRVEWGEPAPGERPDGMTWSVPEPGSSGGEAVLQYDLWSAQRTVLDRIQEEDDDVVAFLAGYATGKSMFGARWLITQALEYPGSRFLVMGVSFQEARETTYKKLFAQLPGERTALTTSNYNGPENSPIVDDYNRQNHRLTLVNDSEIVLGSADKYSRFAGAEFGAVWLDEPSHYGDELHDLLGMLTTRLRGVPGPQKQVWTLTGEGYNSAWEILEKRENADGEPIGLNIHVETASSLDNPYLSDGERAMIRRQYEGTGKEQQAIHGGFSAAEGLTYPQFSRETHVLDAGEADRRVGDRRIYGYDAGFRDPRVLVEIGITSYDQYVILDEFHERDTHVEDAIAWLQRNDKPVGPIYSEHEPTHREKFKRAGWPAPNANKSLDPGLEEVRKRLKPEGNTTVPDTDSSSRGGGRVFDIAPWTATGNSRTRSGGRVVSPSRFSREGRQERTNGPVTDGGGDRDDVGPDETEGRVGLLVSERAEHTIREFLSYKEEQIGTSQATDHCLDATRYAIYTHESG